MFSDRDQKAERAWATDGWMYGQIALWKQLRSKLTLKVGAVIYQLFWFSIETKQNTIELDHFSLFPYFLFSLSLYFPLCLFLSICAYIMSEYFFLPLSLFFCNLVLDKERKKEKESLVECLFLLETLICISTTSLK